MTFNVAFDSGHTMDIGDWVNDQISHEANTAIQGLLFTNECVVNIEGESYGILRCIGITRAEMEFAQQGRAAALIARLQQSGVYPDTIIDRKSVL
jgi:hypothetical protein